MVGLGGGERWAGVQQDWALWKGSAMRLEHPAAPERSSARVGGSSSQLHGLPTG